MDISQYQTQEPSLASDYTGLLVNIFDNLTVNICISRFDTNEILFVNRNMKKDYNLAEDTTHQRCWQVFRSDQNQTCAECPKLQLTKEDVTVTWEDYSAKTHKHYRNTASVIKWLDGSYVHLHHSLDITCEKNTSRILFEAQAVADAANQVKSEFLSRVSHELRTPINAIMGMASIAEMSKDIRKTKRCLQNIMTASQDLDKVTTNILDISSMASHDIQLEHKSFNMETLLINVSKEVGAASIEKSQSMQISMEPDMSVLYMGDANRLSQVILNLLSNAIKFTPKGGKISLQMREKSRTSTHSEIEVDVCDNGIGISQQFQGRLFDSFAQEDESNNRKFGGTGLGLAICKNIIETMAGSIYAISDEASGSSFVFSVMLTREPDAVLKLEKSNIYTYTGTEVAGIEATPVEEDASQAQIYDYSEYIDVDASIALVAGNKELFMTLLQSFLGNNYTTQLEEEIASKNTTAATKTAHALKGISANLSLVKVNEVVTLLEAQLTSDFNCEQTLHELKKTMNTTLFHISALLENYHKLGIQ